MTAVPLVVTLTVDALAQEAWDALRRRWFPPDRLVVGAHVTLFHALPGESADAVLGDCAEVAQGTRPFTVDVDGARSLGRGVALALSAPELAAVHAELRRRWLSMLTRQDAQAFRPHVTVQNKVSPEEAKATLAAVAADPGPRTATATGLAAWRYVGGPWEPLAAWAFASSGA